MQLLRKPFKIIRANVRAYLLVNAVVYGILLIGFGLTVIFPELTQGQRADLESNGDGDLVRSLLSTPWLFAATILGVNVARICALRIVLPSVIVPFAGIAVFVYWTFTTGVTLAPTDKIGWVALIPHSLTVVIEFQAYILFVLGAYLLGNSWLRPRTVGAPNRRRGYVRGLQLLGWLAIPAFALLVIGAIYESFSLIYLVPRLLVWMLS